MKRRTANFIMRQNGEKTGLFSRIDKKTLIVVLSVLLAFLILGGLYLWYVRNYANARKVELEPDITLSYELKEKASDQGIVSDYLWSRTKELMLKNAEDSTLIVDSVTLPGKLIDQVREESGIYKLEDQALLLKIYVANNDRLSAKALHEKIIDRFDIETESVNSKMTYLDALLTYYSSFGTKEDASRITALTQSIFDDEGMIKPQTLEVSKYSGQAFVSTDEKEKALESGSAMGDLEAGGTNGSYQGSDEKKSIEGVLLSSMDLKLIRELEKNGFLPTGSYDKNLKTVKEGVVSSDLPLYAYAYEITDGEISYVYSAGIAGTIDMGECVKTMRSLAAAGELPDDSYAWLKTTLYGSEVFSDTYFMVTGRTDGSESFDSYFDIIEIAIAKEDDSTCDLCLRRIGSHIATLDTSPARSMIFRSEGGRNLTYAGDNLKMCLLLR